MNNFFNRVSVQTILPMIATAMLGVFLILFVVSDKLEEYIYTLEYEKCEDFAKEIEYLIKSDFRILFIEYGHDKKRYKKAEVASKNQLVDKIGKIIEQRSKKYGIKIVENGGVILEKHLDVIKQGGCIETTRNLIPFNWKIEICRDVKDLNETMRKSGFLVSLVIVAMTSINILVLIFLFRNRISKPFDKIFEYISNIHKGDYVPLKIKSSLEIDKLAKNIDDMALKIKDREKELKESLIYIKKIIDFQNEIVLITDGSRIINANKKMFELFYEFKDLDDFKSKYSCICDLFEDVEDENYFTEKDKEVWLEKALSDKNRRYKAKIRNHIFSVAVSKLDEHEYIIVLADITELEKYKNSLERMVQEEVEKNIKKEQQIMEQRKFASIGELLINIAHHWRQPLNNSLLMLQAIADICEEKGALDDEMVRLNEKIDLEIRFLSDTITQFNSIYNKDKIKLSDIKIVDVFEKIFATHRDDFKNITVNITNDDSHIMALESDLIKCFDSVLTNSIEVFSDRKIEHPKIDITIKKSQQGAIVEISDNGGGIDKENLDKVFEPYFTTKFKSRGKGLSLFFVKSIVEIKYNGAVYIENLKDGLKFVMELNNG